MPIWEYLLVRGEVGDPPLPQMAKLVLEYISMVDKFREFIGQQLVPAAVSPADPPLEAEDKTPVLVGRPAPASVKRRRQRRAAARLTAQNGE